MELSRSCPKSRPLVSPTHFSKFNTENNTPHDTVGERCQASAALARFAAHRRTRRALFTKITMIPFFAAARVLLTLLRTARKLRPQHAWCMRERERERAPKMASAPFARIALYEKRRASRDLALPELTGLCTLDDDDDVEKPVQRRAGADRRRCVRRWAQFSARRGAASAGPERRAARFLRDREACERARAALSRWRRAPARAACCDDTDFLKIIRGSVSRVREARRRPQEPAWRLFLFRKGDALGERALFHARSFLNLGREPEFTPCA